MTKDSIDPTGIIREAYRIDGISPEDCRGIFFDWALKVPLEADTSALVRTLLSRHAGEPADHPMTKVLNDALQEMNAPKRRGGRAGRLSS